MDYWKASVNTDGFGWAIVHTARWCHYRKGVKCTAPFPKGEDCAIENCPMRPQDFLDLFPEDYQRLDYDNAGLRAQVAELEVDNREVTREMLCIKAERDALRERCGKLEHELGMSKRNEARWIEKGEEAISERNAANKALEAIKRHQEIVAGTGTAQLSTTWKIANDYLRSKGAALAATEVKP